MYILTYSCQQKKQSNMRRNPHINPILNTSTIAAFQATSAEIEHTVAADWWIPIIAATIPTIIVIVIVLLLLWYRKHISARTSASPHHQISKSPSTSEQQQLDSVSVPPSSEETGKSESFECPEFSENLQSNKASDSITVDIGPDSSTIRSLTGLFQKADGLEVSSRPYRETSKVTTIPTKTKSPEGIVECMNPRAIDYGPPNHEEDVKDWPIQFLKRVLRLKRRRQLP